MNRRLVLVVAVTCCLLVRPEARAQETAAAAEESQGLSLDELEELDALLEDDASRPPLTGRELADIAWLVSVLGFALLSFFTKGKRLKYAALVLSVFYLGFYKKSLVSIVNIYSILLGNFPVFRFSIPWYLLIGFTVVSTVLWGRLYCGRLCAFGALTQLLDAAVPGKLRIEPPLWLDRAAKYVKYAVLAGAILYFLSGGNILAYRYVEPFWMFTLSGNALTWCLVALLLVASLFVRNVYCRYLCSVGASLGVLSKLTVFRIKRWEECQTCKICEKACEWGAIRGPEISVSECVRCDDCERIYRDEKRCVHWLLLRQPTTSSTIPIRKRDRV
jgi:NosR/NirI family nitrous oxide reductase transcriptional regulator